METLKELFTAKTFNKVSYVAVICWTLFGASLLAIFADTENSESRFDFRCDIDTVKSVSNVDFVRGKCFEQYEKRYNKFSIPVYAFVIVNFSLIGIVCVIYSQIVKSRVDALRQAYNSDAERRHPCNPTRRRRKLFIAYCCQLATRFALGIIFIVLQTQLLYPSNFPSNFDCNLTSGGSHATNSSGRNIQNTTYECHNQRATKKTFWTSAVSVVNGVFALLILMEFICILSRARKERTSWKTHSF
ncbi:hypothetical protein OS493_015232 [Desmophyllum pertusum]|uniref:Uncharacterized protein n=1 Tax=Desmophyllum pertusum TaxID=174260 RepID=A0A9W9ZQI6_9CNID|nr:hypothetical protein OS493_015232 [Desmophyllum pertusum]